MKKSAAGSQTLDLNRIDFERAGSGRKAGYKFTIELVNGRVANIISGSPLASDLATVLLQDPATRAILASNDLNVSLNTKFQLTIVNKNAGVNPPAKGLSAETSQPNFSGEDGPREFNDGQSAGDGKAADGKIAAQDAVHDGSSETGELAQDGESLQKKQPSQSE